MAHRLSGAVGRAVGREAETGVAKGGQTTDQAGAPEFQTKYHKHHGPRRTSAEAECRSVVPHTHGGTLLGGALVGALLIPDVCHSGEQGADL